MYIIRTGCICMFIHLCFICMFEYRTLFHNMFGPIWLVYFLTSYDHDNDTTTNLLQCQIKMNNIKYSR